MGKEVKLKIDPTRSISWFRLVRDQALVTPEVLNWDYEGSGTEDDPYSVVWIDHDPRNPMLFAQWKKWALTGLVSIATLAVAFVSSAYTGGIDGILVQFNTSDEVVTLGVSLFVLGFALGPLMYVNAYLWLLPMRWIIDLLLGGPQRLRYLDDRRYSSVLMLL